MRVNPYSFEDQHKPEWHRLQQQLAGTYTSGTCYDPPPSKAAQRWDVPSFEVPKVEIVSPGPRAHYGPSVVDSIGQSLADLTEWMVTHISPLELVREWGIRVSRAGRATRLPLSVFGLIVGAGLFSSDAAASFWPVALLTNLTGNYAGIAIVAAAAAFGWALPTIAGFVVVFIVHLTGLTIGLTAIAAGLALAYSILALAMGWPLPGSLGIG